MGVGTGQPINELHCPTCGNRIVDLNLYVENAEEEFSVEKMIAPIKSLSRRRYLACPYGHRWTVIMLWRVRNQTDRVQLGEYMGEI